MPLYNHADHLPIALDSLLSQTDTDLAIVLVDDLSSDATAAIAARYTDRDERVSYFRNDTRLGLVANWRRCFQLGRRLYPDAQYFAWGSDHDVWHPRWLERLRRELEQHPELVLAYPLAERITAEGEVVRCRGGFESFGNHCRRSRLRHSCGPLHAGDMVYGLVRAQGLQAAGVFRRVLEPDRLLMAELAVQGEFRHVAERLWQRRFVDTAVRARQRRAIFPGRRPLYSWLPPWMVRPAVFAWLYVVAGAGRPAVGRLEGLALAVRYAFASIEQVTVRRWRQLRKKVARAKKRAARRRKRLMARTVKPLGGFLRTGRSRLGKAQKRWSEPMRRFMRSPLSLAHHLLTDRTQERPSGARRFQAGVETQDELARSLVSAASEPQRPRRESTPDWQPNGGSNAQKSETGVGGSL